MEKSRGTKFCFFVKKQYVEAFDKFCFKCGEKKISENICKLIDRYINEVGGDE